MNSSYPIPESVRAQFPKSANRTVRVAHAWHPEESALDRPAPNGPDGWTHIGQVATYAILRKLLTQGFTWVNLETSGVANPRKDVRISDLI